MVHTLRHINNLFTACLQHLYSYSLLIPSINKVLLKPIYELTPPFGDALYNVLKTPVCVTIGSSAPVKVVHTPLAVLTNIIGVKNKVRGSKIF